LAKILLLNFSLVNGYEFIRAKFSWFKKAKRDTKLTLPGYKEKGEKVSLGHNFILFDSGLNPVCHYSRLNLFQRLWQLDFP